MSKSKLTSKYQATVPKEIREFLCLESGDGILWEIENETVVITKVSKVDLEWQRSLESTLSEWSSQHDQKAYDSL